MTDPTTRPAASPSPRVRAVVVNWNGAHLLPDCLASLEDQTVRDLMEVVVVDNASTDASLDVLSTHRGVRVVRSPRNTGFAGGAALGTRDTAAEFVVLLNSDATFAPDAVERLVAAARAPGHERVGAVTAKILLGTADQDGPRLVNSTGNIISRRGTGADRDWLAADGSESSDPDVFGFCGGAALLRSSALRATGGFDPRLFLYYEDTDLSWRLRSRGWTVRYEASAVAHHLHAASSDVASPLFRYWNTRNSLVVFARHAPVAVVIASGVRQVAGAAVATLRALRGDRTGRAVARWRGLAAFLVRLPRTMGERGRLRRSARVDRRTVARHLVP